MDNTGTDPGKSRLFYNRIFNITFVIGTGFILWYVFYYLPEIFKNSDPRIENLYPLFIGETLFLAIALYCRYKIWTLPGETGQQPTITYKEQDFTRHRIGWWSKIPMGSMLAASWRYAWTGYVSRWVVLAGFAVIFPLGLGYLVQVMKRRTSAPEPEGYYNQFSDGMNLIIVLLGMGVLLFILFIIGTLILTLLMLVLTFGFYIHTNDPSQISNIAWPALFIGCIVWFIFSSYGTMGMVRFARTGLVEEAFELGAIWETIKKISLLRIIVAQIMLLTILLCPLVLAFLLKTGIQMATGMRMFFFSFFIVFISFFPVMAITAARFASLLYDEGTETAETEMEYPLQSAGIRDQLQSSLPGSTQRWNLMEIRSLVRESWKYARDRYISRWAVLAVCAAIFPLGLGYLMQVLKGTSPAPKPEKFRSLFIDGLKMIPVLTGYAIVFLLFVKIPYISAPIVTFFFFYTIKSPGSRYFHTYVIAAALFFCLFMFLIPPVTHAIFLIVYILTVAMGITRFAKTEMVREAYHIRKIWGDLHATGWWQLVGAVMILPISIILILELSGLFTPFTSIITTHPILCLGIMYFAVITIGPIIAIMAGRCMSLLNDTGIDRVVIPDTRTVIYI